MRLLLGRDPFVPREADRTRAEADRNWRSVDESTDLIDDAGPDVQSFLPRRILLEPAFAPI